MFDKRVKLDKSVDNVALVELIQILTQDHGAKSQKKTETEDPEAAKKEAEELMEAEKSVKLNSLKILHYVY